MELAFQGSLLVSVTERGPAFMGENEARHHGTSYLARYRGAGTVLGWCTVWVIDSASQKRLTR